jgi:hypothetical protein
MIVVEEDDGCIHLYLSVDAVALHVEALDAEVCLREIIDERGQRVNAVEQAGGERLADCDSREDQLGQGITKSNNRCVFHYGSFDSRSPDLLTGDYSPCKK